MLEGVGCRSPSLRPRNLWHPCCVAFCCETPAIDGVRNRRHSVQKQTDRPRWRYVSHSSTVIDKIIVSEQRWLMEDESENSQWMSRACIFDRLRAFRVQTQIQISCTHIVTLTTLRRDRQTRVRMSKVRFERGITTCQYYHWKELGWHGWMSHRLALWKCARSCSMCSWSPCTHNTYVLSRARASPRPTPIMPLTQPKISSSEATLGTGWAALTLSMQS